MAILMTLVILLPMEEYCSYPNLCLALLQKTTCYSFKEYYFWYLLYCSIFSHLTDMSLKELDMDCRKLCLNFVLVNLRNAFSASICSWDQCFENVKGLKVYWKLFTHLWNLYQFPKNQYFIEIIRLIVHYYSHEEISIL